MKAFLPYLLKCLPERGYFGVYRGEGEKSWPKEGREGGEAVRGERWRAREKRAAEGGGGGRGETAGVKSNAQEGGEGG
jgi:hypothetical protein